MADTYLTEKIIIFHIRFVVIEIFDFKIGVKSYEKAT